VGEIELSVRIFILFFIFFTIPLNALSPLEVGYEKLKLENFNVGFILDKNNSLSLDEIRESKFKTTSNRHAFGNTPTVVWIKIEIKNTTEIEKEMFLHNDFAYFSKEISISEFTNNKLVDKNIYNTLDKESNKLTGSVLVYPLTIQAQNSKTLYIKTVPVVTQMASLNIYDKKNYIKALINRSFLPNIIIVILFSLAFYNIFLYFFNRKKEFVYYALYLVNAAIGLSYMYGTVFQNFGIYGEDVYWINITAILVSLFLALFVKSVFDFKNSSKLINNLLNSIMYIVILDILVAIFIDLQSAIYLLQFIFPYSFIVIFYIGFTLYKQVHPLANIFLVAYTIYIIGFAITLLSMAGLIPLNFLTFHASGISLVLEALLFSYLINYNIKLLENKISEQQNTLIVKNQKEQMGDMIGAITHQWKQPLSAIGSTVMLLQFKIKEKVEIETDYLYKKLSLIDKHMRFLNETIDDFRNFFNPKKIKQECDLKQLIDKAVSLSKDDILANEIIIKQDLKFTKNISIFESELLHILLNIIQNAKEAFRDGKLEENSIKMIKIIGRTDEDRAYIDIIDNAGGISAENLPYIFHENYTTKGKEKGVGLGLYLSKIVIEEHMNGSIEAKNIGDGSMFRIIL